MNLVGETEVELQFGIEIKLQIEFRFLKNKAHIQKFVNLLEKIILYLLLINLWSLLINRPKLHLDTNMGS